MKTFRSRFPRSIRARASLVITQIKVWVIVNCCRGGQRCDQLESTPSVRDTKVRRFSQKIHCWEIHRFRLVNDAREFSILLFTRKHFFLYLQSDSSHCSSVESLLEARKPDAEAILINLGFGPVHGSDDVVSKIPKRWVGAKDFAWCFSNIELNSNKTFYNSPGS